MCCGGDATSPDILRPRYLLAASANLSSNCPPLRCLMLPDCDRRHVLSALAYRLLQLMQGLPSDRWRAIRDRCGRKHFDRCCRPFRIAEPAMKLAQAHAERPSRAKSFGGLTVAQRRYLLGWNEAARATGIDAVE